MSKQKETQRKLVEKYLAEHELESTLQEILNNCVKERPTDPYIYLATALRECSSTTTGIISIVGRTVYDNRGVQTLVAEVTTGQGIFSASVPVADPEEDPQGRGMAEMRDKDGSVTKAVANINNIIAKVLVNMNPVDQDAIDGALIDLDGTDRFTKLGANAILAVSMACCRAGAAEKDVPLYKHISELSAYDCVNLPVPFFNMIAGGKHAPNSQLNFQEFLAAPIYCKSFREAMETGLKVYTALGKMLLEKYPDTFKLTDINEQGAYCPPIDNALDAIQILCEAISEAGAVDLMRVAIDVAATSMKHAAGEEEEEEEEGAEPKQKYNLMYKMPEGEPQVMDSQSLSEYYNDMFESFPEMIVSLEDPFGAEDWDGFAKFTSDYGESIQVVGDELIASNADMILKCVEQQACNAVSLKIDQIATVSDCIRASKAAKECGWGVCFAHRSGETSDTFLADIVAGTCAGQLKCGAPIRGERMAKFNRLLMLEEECQDKKIDAAYCGVSYRLPPS